MIPFESSRFRFDRATLRLILAFRQRSIYANIAFNLLHYPSFSGILRHLSLISYEFLS